MTAHEWDSGTPYCTRCGIQKGWHAEECLAMANVVGFMHHLKKRQREGKTTPSTADTGFVWKREGIIVEAFPREPA